MPAGQVKEVETAQQQIIAISQLEAEASSARGTVGSSMLSNYLRTSRERAVPISWESRRQVARRAGT
jgi:hypothetical protein